MDDGAGSGDPSQVKLFGDPRSKFVERGPDRRVAQPSPANINGVAAHDAPPHHSTRSDFLSTALAVLGLLVFGSALITGVLILYNAKTVGALRNPWDSTRVAIGLAVLALGVVQSAVLIGVSRILSMLAADRRRRT